MLTNIRNDVWFDSEKLYILKGQENKARYLLNYEKYPAIKKNKASTYPVIIFLSSTACNLQCSYCFADEGTYGKNSEKTFFEFEDYCHIFDNTITQYGGVMAINFFGGEPLLNFKTIKQFVEYLSNSLNQEDMPILSIATNGTIMNSDIKQFLKRYNVAFGTSLDGPKSLNDVSRKGKAFTSVYDEVAKTLDFIADLPIKKALQFTISKSHVANYKTGDAQRWAEEMEKIGVDYYEIVPVSTDIENVKIDVSDPAILHQYKKLCSEVADYCLKLFISQKTTVMPRIFNGIILHIIKREYQRDCSAGFSFTASPDQRIYPCHVCADEREFGVSCTEKFKDTSSLNKKFQKISNLTKENMIECNECFAKNMCPYICKGLIYKNNGQLLEERCIMMRIFAEKTILFLSEKYAENKESIKSMLLRIANNSVLGSRYHENQRRSSIGALQDTNGEKTDCRC